MKASVIVCTYNRADSLLRTLDCLAAQVVRAGWDWEIVVVDNNSRDDTKNKVLAAAATTPGIRYGFESTQGLSHARNHGIAISRGEILLFTDDDVCPEPDWVQKVLDGMDAHGCDACGGYIAPVWEAPPPPWLTPRFHGFLAVRAERSDTYPITVAADAPYGANMAITRKTLDAVGGFDTGRGRKGSDLASGEDGELFERILARGLKVMFFGDARVHHRVEAFRLTKAYFRRWRFQTSRNLARQRDLPGRNRLFGVPLYLYPQLLRAIGRAARDRLRSPHDEAFFREILVWHFLGTIQGLYQRRAVRASPP